MKYILTKNLYLNGNTLLLFYRLYCSTCECIGDFYEEQWPILVVINLIVKMTRRKPLIAVNKKTSVSDIAKGITLEAVAKKIAPPCEDFSALFGKSRTKEDTE